MANSLELSLPGAVSSQSEQDDTQLVKASPQGTRVGSLCLPRVKSTAPRLQYGFAHAAWLWLPSVPDEAGFATWLYCITYNCYLRQFE